MKAIRLVGALLIVLAMAGPVLAQEGHPLSGVWSGDWGPSPTHRNQVTLVMAWDGKAISGKVGFGPDASLIKVATLDSSKWTVHIEFDSKDSKGNVIRFIADGKLENIGSYNRTITGTWSHGNVKGDFKIQRAS